MMTIMEAGSTLFTPQMKIDSAEEDTANADERRGLVETDIVIRDGTLANSSLASSAKQKDRIEATRILTPRDFERLKELQKGCRK